MHESSLNKAGTRHNWAKYPMVLKESSDSRLYFQSRSLIFGLVIAPFAVFLCLCAWHATFYEDSGLWWNIILYSMAFMFSYGAIKNLTTTRSLEINFISKRVNLHEKIFFSETNRSDRFEQFNRLTVSGDYEGYNYAINLENNDGWIEYLGWSEFGAMSLARALELANKIAPKMGIELNAPTYFEEKPLKKTDMHS
jgi:hypothetical protein